MAKNVFEVKTEETNLNVRGTADLNGAVVAQLAKGALVEVISASNGWAKVKVNGKDGYVSSAYLSSTSNAYEVTTASGNLNIRATADANGAIAGSAAKGSFLKVKAISGDWAEVEFGGKSAFAAVKFLTKVTENDIDMTAATAQSSMFGSSTL